VHGVLIYYFLLNIYYFAEQLLSQEPYLLVYEVTLKKVGLGVVGFVFRVSGFWLRILKYSGTIS
jgi:hypothetical protein